MKVRVDSSYTTWHSCLKAKLKSTNLLPLLEAWTTSSTTVSSVSASPSSRTSIALPWSRSLTWTWSIVWAWVRKVNISSGERRMDFSQHLTGKAISSPGPSHQANCSTVRSRKKMPTMTKWMHMKYSEQMWMILRIPVTFTVLEIALWTYSSLESPWTNG